MKRKAKDSISDYARSKKKVQEIQSKKVQLGWVHYDEKQRKYIGVRTPRGGGTRDVPFPFSASAKEIIEVGKELFYPNGNSCHGLISDMDFKITIIENLKIDGEEVPFTLGQYINATKLPKVRLYLASKKRPKDESKTVASKIKPPKGHFKVTSLITNGI